MITIKQSIRKISGTITSVAVTAALTFPMTIGAAHADPVTAVILASPSADGADARKEYSEKVNPLGAEAGIEIVAGVRVKDALIGKAGYKSVFLLGFPSEDAAATFFSSTDYQALIPLRDEGYDVYEVLIGQ